jgi:hypothetical protein
MGVNGDGRRELLGLKAGNSKTESFWAEFISRLKERGLDGVKLVISDAPCCRVHFARNLLQCVPKAHQGMVTSALRSMFAKESAENETRWDDLAASLAERFPKDHWRKIWSSNLLERVNEKIKRRTMVEGIFPIVAANYLRPNASTPTRWGRCCWNNTSTGSWRAAACFLPRAWRPSRSSATSPPCRPSAPERGQNAGPRAAAATPVCIDHSGSQHIGDRTKDVTSQSLRFIMGSEGESAPPE